MVRPPAAGRPDGGAAGGPPGAVARRRPSARGRPDRTGFGQRMVW